MLRGGCPPIPCSCWQVIGRVGSCYPVFCGVSAFAHVISILAVLLLLRVTRLCPARLGSRNLPGVVGRSTIEECNLAL